MGLFGVIESMKISVNANAFVGNECGLTIKIQSQPRALTLTGGLHTGFAIT